MKALIAGFVALSLLLAASPAAAVSFSLDDNPRAPVGVDPGGIPVPPGPQNGAGAEDPYGWTIPVGAELTPSPSLAGAFCDGDILGPGPVGHLHPDGFYVDSVSLNTPDPGMPIYLKFSVDRGSAGAPGTAVRNQWTLNQQPGDIFQTTAQFRNPANYVGTLVGPGMAGTGYVGNLGAYLSGPRNNTLLIDEMALGLLAGGALVPSNQQAQPIVPGSHDNVDGVELSNVDSPNPPPWPPGDAAGWTYFTVYPDEALLVNAAGGGPAGPIWPADIFDVAPGAPGTMAWAYATSVSMGLDLLNQALFDDSIDALIMFDRDQLGGPANGGPGAQPGVDFALFSLAPSSISLNVLAAANIPGVQVNDADVFFTDFSGLFATYATSADLGLQPELGGGVLLFDNVDALELNRIPEPASMTLLGGALLGLLIRRRRRK